MKKTELLKKLEIALQEKGMKNIGDINSNSNKDEIENAINCLHCSDEKLDMYVNIIESQFPNIGKLIKCNNQYKYDRHIRLYIYNTARLFM